MRSAAVTLSAGEEITAPLTETRPGGDPGLRLAPRGEAGPRHHLGDALALFVIGGFFGHEHAFMALPAFMQFALEEARAAGSRGEVPVGCVIVRDGEVVARAGNRTLGRQGPDRACRIAGDPPGGGRARHASGLPIAISM